DQLVKASPADVRIPYAMALVAIQNHQWADAAQLLNTALAGGRPLLPIRRTSIWLHLNRKEFEPAQQEMRELSGLLTANPTSATAQDTARWLGKVIGFYSGPGANRIKAADLDSLVSDLIAKFSGPLLDAFNQGQDETAKSIEDLQTQQATLREQAKTQL